MISPVRRPIMLTNMNHLSLGDYRFTARRIAKLLSGVLDRSPWNFSDEKETDALSCSRQYVSGLTLGGHPGYIANIKWIIIIIKLNLTLISPWYKNLKVWWILTKKTFFPQLFVQLQISSYQSLHFISIRIITEKLINSKIRKWYFAVNPVWPIYDYKKLWPRMVNYLVPSTWLYSCLTKLKGNVCKLQLHFFHIFIDEGWTNNVIISVTAQRLPSVSHSCLAI